MKLTWLLAAPLMFGTLACKDAGAGSPATPAPDQPAETHAAEPAAPPVAPAASVRPAPAPPRDGLPATAEVAVEIASVTLGEDCGANAAGARPVPGLEAPAIGQRGAADDAPARAAVGESAGPAAKMARRACEQTSVQLSLRAGPGAASPSIEVRQVRLTDASGTVLGSLVPRDPRVWSPDGAYVPWNQTIEPDTTLSVGYSLSAPDWGKIPDRYSKTYRLEVTLAVGGVERAVTKEVKISAPTIMPPNVAT